MNLHLVKYRLPVRYMACYLTVIALPILLIVAYFYPIRLATLKNNALNTVREQNEHIRIVTDMQLDSVYGLVPKINANPKLTPFALSQGAYAEIEAIDEMRMQVSASNLIFDVLLYSMQQDTLYTTSRLIRMSTYGSWRNAYRYADWDPAEFATYLNTQTSADILSSKQFQSSEGITTNVVTFVFPLSQYLPMRNVLLVLVSTNALRSLLDSPDFYDEGDVYILDGNQELIVSLNHSEPVRIANLISDGNARIISVSDKDTIVCASRSTRHGGYYLSTLSMDTVISGLKQYRNEMLALISTLLFVETLLAWLFAKHNYKPIKTLSENVRAFTTVEPRYDVISASDDEFKAIEKALHTLANTNTLLTNRVSDALPALRSDLLRCLLGGRILTVEQFNSLGRSLRMEFSFGAWVVAVLSLSSEDDFTSAALMLAQRCDTPENVQLYAIADTRRNTIIIICCQEVEQDAVNTLADLREQIEEEIGIAVFMGVSGVAYEPQSICLLYIQAISVIEVLASHEGRRYLRMQDVTGNDYELSDYPVGAFYRLSIAIAKRNGNDLMSVVEEIADFLDNPKLPGYYLRAVYRNTSVALLRPLLSADRENTTGMEHLNAFLADEMIDPAKCRRNLILLTENLCRRLSDIDSRRRDALIREIMTYVENHYLDSDFSIQTISTRFCMTASNFSHFFKSHVDITFKQFVDYIKIERAKSLLADGNTLDYIARFLDYGNVSSFIRAFKRVTNSTPGGYRDTHND